jgi:hypothetical protein
VVTNYGVRAPNQIEEGFRARNRHDELVASFAGSVYGPWTLSHLLPGPGIQVRRAKSQHLHLRVIHVKRLGQIPLQGTFDRNDLMVT